MSRIRILSNNQWYCDKNQPKWIENGLDCSAEARAKGFARVFEEIDADVIGLQECSPLMADLHMQHLLSRGAGYALLWGRDTPILYKKDKFTLIDSDYFIYPEAIPNFEGSFNNSKTKSYCISVLRSKEDGKLLIFATTHLWWMSGDPKNPYFRLGSDEARAYQIGILIDRIDAFQKKYGCPAIIVGDLNARRDSPALRATFARGYVHARSAAVEYVNEGHGYHQCDGMGFDTYVPKDAEFAIDHILIKNMPEETVKRYDILSEDYYMPLSDHLPLWIDIEL